MRNNVKLLLRPIIESILNELDPDKIYGLDFKPAGKKYTKDDLKFVNGQCIIKVGNKIIAKITDKSNFFKNTKVNFDQKYPYSLLIPNLGQRDCKSIDDVLDQLNKYSYVNTPSARK